MKLDEMNQKAREENNCEDNFTVYYQICSNQKCSDICKIEEFVGHLGKNVTRCSKCREVDKIADDKRMGRDRKVDDQKPERIVKKLQWNEKNHEKVLDYSRDHRTKKRDEMGDEEYRKQNAENHQDYMDRNIDQKIKRYIDRAERDELEWKLFEDDCKILFESSCFYCDQTKKSCGIDRKVNSIGYIKNNCVSSCSMCNNLKGDLENDVIFINMIRHIMSQMGLMKDEYYYENYDLFECQNYTKYWHYISRAHKNNIIFEMTKEDYKQIIGMNCYICNKKGMLGVDRIDNNKGYILGNVAPCCKTCNYLKYTYNIYDIYRKSYEIVLNKYNGEIIIVDNNTIKEKVDLLLENNYKNISEHWIGMDNIVPNIEPKKRKRTDRPT